jgi:hypothetical protein
MIEAALGIPGTAGNHLSGDKKRLWKKAPAV